MRHLGCLLAIACLPALSSLPVQAQGDAGVPDGYQRPPESLARLVEAPAMPVVSLSPDRSTVAILTRPALPGIAEVAARELRLAGIRIDPATSSRSRSSGYTEVRLRSLADDEARLVAGLPPSPRVAYLAWSPDGARLALTLLRDDRVELWVADAAEAVARRLSDRPLNAVFGSPCSWFPDGRSLVCLVVPEDRGPEPAPPSVPSGPVVQENTEGVAPVRTYQDLLQNDYDAALFRHYATSDLLWIDVGSASRRIAGPALYTSVDPSPDGLQLLTEHLHEPFSFLVPYSRFSRAIEVLDLDGNLLYTVADLPPAENVPTGFDSTPTGPRSVSWRADEAGTLVWVEALDGGDANAEAEWRDVVRMLPAPFEGDPDDVLRLAFRHEESSWLGDGRVLITESWWRTRRERVHLVDLTSRDKPARLWLEYSSEDRYNDPGDFLTLRDPRGALVVATTPDGEAVYVAGEGASPDGDRPFLRTISLADGSTRELFRSSAPFFEVPLSLLDSGAERVLTRRESADQPPNYMIRNVRSGALTPLTDNPHPYPELAGIRRELITYAREDGLPLSAELYLPPGYDPATDGPLPTVVWAYPVEYKSGDAAGQVSGSPYRFKSVSYWGPLPFLTRGYAVLDRTAMPIVGEGEQEPNDSFRSQLVMNARAAVLEGVRRGVVDPDRVAVGGHSYGAFMTANLLAHSDLFRAGIARSGAYNRTLTPFGFQSEERTYWDAPHVYYDMSPFMHAEKVNEPILLIHGEADNNSGTFPIQSERFFAALKGHGATARLVFLPHESHGYQARESLLHMLWEEDRWLDRYVKNAPARPAVETQRLDTGP